MRKQDNQIIYSPSDLIVFMESEFGSWMDRFYLEFPKEVKPDEVDAGQKIIQDKGNEHEEKYVEQLKAGGTKVREITGADAWQQTLKAMEEGCPVIYQAELRKDNFAGKADFLKKVPGASKLGDYHYGVWDTKLSRKAKPYFLVQLCCYAEMLEAIQGTLPEFIGVVLGDCSEKKFRTSDYLFYYRRLKQELLEKQAKFNRDNAPVPTGTNDDRRWTSYAEKILEERDHLSLVANMRNTQIRKLEKANITTMTQLSEAAIPHVAKMDPKTLATLKAQARLQVASPGLEHPKYELIATPPGERRGLALLPPACSLDVFFDMEGYPHMEGGLEYLFGVSYHENGALEFKDWWAHNRDEEKIAFEKFIDWVIDRWNRDKTMHIYHYAEYEVTALRKLMGRHGTREQEVDTLLRNNVFVNLFTVVRQGLRVGTPNYSIKSIELLYRDKRSTEVANAMDSVVFYQNWIEEPDGQEWQTSTKLREIRDYNKDDCDSTAMLADWLRGVQASNGVAWIAPAAPPEPSATAQARDEVARLAQEMLANLPAEENARRLQELLAHLLEFHWRESRPVFWAKYDRADMTEQQLIEDPNCLGGLQRTATPPERVKNSHTFEYSFDPSQDTKLDVGKTCFFSHDLKLSADIYSLDDIQGRISLKLGPSKPIPPDKLNLIPDEFVNPEKIAESIYRTVSQWRTNGKLPRAIEDFLLRRPPRINGNPSGPIIPRNAEITAAAITAIQNMDHTTLCIQGPPGSGKTTKGARIILQLLHDGKRIGITSNSHKAIANLLKSVCDAAKTAGVSFAGTKIQSDNDNFHLDGTTIVASKNASEAFGGKRQYQLVAGTAFALSDEAAVGQFDYLFVDEAGQVSIANLVGMAPCTNNIIVMGDQMQLSQPIQGSHPGESGKSVLEFLLGEHQTVPEDFGIFLGTTYRLHPEICQFISSAIYEGRLHADKNTSRRHLVLAGTGHKYVTRQSGILYIPVEHEGNTQGSDEEAQAIGEIIDELLQCQLRDFDTNRPGQFCRDFEITRQVRPEDILVVAPYNMQVRNLKSKHLPDHVGTVDKFQGQEKPVVIVSMCASDGNESPRGIEFLFNKNRLNVALTRAKCLAIVVGSPALARTATSNVQNMELINLYCRIVEEGQQPAPQLVGDRRV